ncbi:MAG: CDGSH iron-sulfur domain-containing protein [Candidatus Firestonebacteria bacterium]
MAKDESKMKVKIVKNGPYVVSGNVPLAEKIIVPNGKGYIYEDGDELPQYESYALCRCGETKN